MGLYSPFSEPIQTSTGVPTGMLLGSINGFLAVCRKFQFDSVAFTFDHGRSSYRLKIRSTYKSNRNADQVDMGPQFRDFERFLDIIKVPHIRIKAIEADDIIASLVLLYGDSEVTVITADHDMLQLVSDNVLVLKPAIGQRPEVLFDSQAVYLKYGVRPTKLPELWALSGDRGDGIDGIPGVGPVTALKMMKQFGSLSSVMAHHPKCKGYGQLVSDNYDMISLNGLVAMNYIPDNLDFTFNKSYPDELREFFKEFELSTLVRKFDQKTLWD